LRAKRREFQRLRAAADQVILAALLADKGRVKDVVPDGYSIPVPGMSGDHTDGPDYEEWCRARLERGVRRVAPRSADSRAELVCLLELLYVEAVEVESLGDWHEVLLLSVDRVRKAVSLGIAEYPFRP
jgi:hypothetical protein